LEPDKGKTIAGKPAAGKIATAKPGKYSDGGDLFLQNGQWLLRAMTPQQPTLNL
jgi:hypothetical protein